MSTLCTAVQWKDRATGDIGFVSGIGVISDLIRAGQSLAHEATDPDFNPSHAFLISRGANLEAVWPRVCLNPLDEYARPAYLRRN